MRGFIILHFTDSGQAEKDVIGWACSTHVSVYTDLKILHMAKTELFTPISA
jgi:hypothetical protein